jgi:hypothetical protein
MRSRNGIHKVSQSLNRRGPRYATRMLAGARRPRRPNDLLLLCRILTRYLRVVRRMEKRDPHLFGPHARDYFLDTLRIERQQQENEAALRKVYGPPDPSRPAPVSTLWTDRYHFSSPRQRRLFLNWFHEQYPSP